MNLKKSFFIAFGMTLLAGAMPSAVSAQSAAQPNIFGYRAWSGTPEHDDLGWYRISPEGDTSLEWIDESDVLPAYFISGWIRDGKLCGIYGNRSTSYHLTYDVVSGEFIGPYEIFIEGPDAYKYMFTAAYNSDDDYVYGFSYNEDFSQDYFVRAPATDLNAVEIIRAMPNDYTMCLALCFNDVDHHIYGVDFFGDLIRIDVNGNFELAALYGLSDDTRKLADYATGMCYSPLENCFYWNRQLATYESSWVRIDAGTFEYTNVKELPLFDHYTILASTDNDGDPAGPVRPLLVSDVAGLDNISLTFAMPEKLANGGSVDGTMKYFVRDIRDSKFVEGTAAAGEEVSISLPVAEQGEHTFQIFCSADGKRGVSKFVNRWIGYDAPARPANVKLAKEGEKYLLSWDAVSTGTHGGMVKADDITYVVKVNGQVVDEVEGKTSILVDAPNDPKLTVFTASVTAIMGDLSSDEVASNKVASNVARELPFILDPTDEQMMLLTFFNPDGDKSEWKEGKDFSGKKALFCSADPKNASNDWVFLPAINFDNTEYLYEMQMSVAANSNTKKGEYLEVVLASACDPQNVIRTVMERTNIVGTTAQTLSVKFGVPAAGKYYVALHAVSEPAMSGIYVRDVKFRKTRETAAIESVPADENTPKIIYAPDGQIVYEGTTPIADLHLTPGLYIVRHGNKTSKVIIK